jgi:dynein heavy chain
MLSAGKLVGDVLLAAAFVSYAGPFNMEFRKRLVTEKWLPDITERQIPLTSGFMPLDMLADESAKVLTSIVCTQHCSWAVTQSFC